MSKLTAEEFRMELKYGQIIAGKWWGSKEKRPILMLHGWQDNAGTFDTLISLLPPNYGYLAIDLPGHGFSSHLPAGCSYHILDYLPILEEIRKKMKWDRLSLISHSMGLVVSFFYGAMYPENVDFIVGLDKVKPTNLATDQAEKQFTFRTLQRIKLMENMKEESPEYTYDELVPLIVKGSSQSVDNDKAKYLISRGTKPSTNNPNKFDFSRDIRIKYMQPFFVDQALTMAYIQRIKAAYLFIKSDRIGEPEENVREAVDMFTKCNSNFEMFKVPGTHHVHLNQPELMAEKIGTFIEKFICIEDST